MIECEPNFFKSEINKIETTIANPVIFGATHTQTVSDIIRIGWKFSSEILNLYLLYNKFTIKNVSVCLPIEKEWNIYFLYQNMSNKWECMLIDRCIARI